jgi:hypothetical protein
MRSTLDQHRNALAEQQTENIIMRDILASRGIAFQAEFENRKAAMMMQPRNGSFAPSITGSRSGSHGQISPTALSSSGRSPPSATHQKYSNGGLSGNSGLSLGSGSYHGHSAAEPGISERVIKAEQTAVSDMPGIFERNQQLGIDFILGLVGSVFVR